MRQMCVIYRVGSIIIHLCSLTEGGGGGRTSVQHHHAKRVTKYDVSTANLTQ